MNLIVNSIAIISSETKMAKIQHFVQGINVVTSPSKIDGNWIGKSSLLGSIFHTLGADCWFSDKWQKEGLYIYLLDFNIDDNNYLMLRRNKLFKLFDENKSLIFSVSDRNELTEELLKLFNQAIYLKNHEGIYKLAHPVYNYLLNYIDQNKIQPTTFQSFAGLNAFTDYYNDLIYSQLGVHNDNSNALKEEEKRLILEKKEVEERQKILNEMNKEIEKNIGTVLDLNSLQKNLAFHEQRYRNLANQINKHKKKLNDAYNLKAELEELLKEIDNLIKYEKKELKSRKCSHCNSVLSDSQFYYFCKVKYIDGYGLQKLSIEDKLNYLKRKIELESQQYERILTEIKSIEKEIFNGSNEIKDGLKALGLNEIIAKIIRQIGETEIRINSLKERIKEVKKSLREIEKRKKEIDKEYTNVFNNILLKYSITGLEQNSIEKASTKIKVDGTHNNIIAVAWLCSLLKIKYKFNPNAIKYPLIFDTPNNADLDEKNQQKIFRLIFDNLPENGQIITSLIGFKESDYENYKINKITLENQKYLLLNKEDYFKCIEKYNYLNFFN